MSFTSVALIGFGEVGGILARDLALAGVSDLRAFDLVFADPGSKRRAAAELTGVRVCADAATAVDRAQLVICAVTAGQALGVARAISNIGHAPFYLDVNSVAPETKRHAAEAVERAGGRYVEAAVMTSVPPHGIASPMLLGGAHAATFAPLGAALGMKLTVFADTVGPASSVKMCRSIMIKGLEALTTECMLSARHYGVEAHVLRSLADTLPHPDWATLARYMIGRALVHGRRRAEEVREVAVTVRDAGIEPIMSERIAVRQDWAADIGLMLGREALQTTELTVLLDAVTAAIQRQNADAVPA